MAAKRRIPKSYLWAAAFTLVMGAWLASGMAPELLRAATETDVTPGPTTTAAKPADPLFRVRVETFSSRTKPAEIAVRGRTETSRRVEVRARTSGIVESVPHQEGENIAPGDLLCRLDEGVRLSELAEERAALASAEIDFKVANELAQQNFGSQTKKASEKAKLDAARASVERMETEIAYVSIGAPIAGVLESQIAEIGSFLQVGGHCATIVVLDPLLVVVHVGQQDIATVAPGMEVAANFITGQSADGKVTFVAPSADQATRTFRVEIEVANPDLSIRAGITSDVRFKLAPVIAHKLPASVLTLNDHGQIGVRSVDADNIVRFMPVAILDDERDGIWVSGLPDTLSVITVGQDYVLDGQKVEPVSAAAETAAR